MEAVLSSSEYLRSHARKKMKAQRKILALHESVRPALLDELIKRFDFVRFTTDPSAKDIRYTLDYIVNAILDWHPMAHNIEQRLL